MSKSASVLSFPDKDKIKQEAALWVSKCETRPLQRRQREELRAWLSQSSLHVEEFETLAALWDQMDILDELNYLDGVAVEKGSMSWLKSVASFRSGRLAAAAALVVMCLSTFAVFNSFGTDPAQIEATRLAYSTTLGEQKTVTLEDGTVVTLNTSSRLEVAYSSTSRDVHLYEGEAHFEVASDKSKPFSVHTKDGVVQAVGTAFSVRLDPETVRVTVSEGRVKLTPLQEMPLDEAVAVGEAVTKELELAAGDTAQFVETRAELLQPLTEAEINRQLSWRRGLLAFAGEPLSEVVQEVSRYTDVLIVFEDSELEQLPIGGYFKAGEVDGLLEAIEQTFDVEVEHLSEQTVRLRLKNN